MPRLFSYVVDHDLGFSPDPFAGFCTLVHCKFSRTGRRLNIVELAQRGDWVVGTGGLSPKSAGHGRMIYAMKVTEKLPLLQYYCDRRFRLRPNDFNTPQRKDRFALVSTDFFYFGVNAIPMPLRFASKPFEKKGPGFRSDFDEAVIAEFERWLRRSHRPGVNGDPCGGRPAHASGAVPAIVRCTSTRKASARRGCK